MRRRWLVVFGLICSASLLTGARCVAQESLPAAAGAAAAPKATFEQDVSYAIGLMMGRDLIEKQIPVDAQYLFTGIRDALTQAQPRLSNEQITQVMTRFEQVMNEKIEKQMASDSEKNKATGAKFLADNAKKPGVTTTGSGLQYKVVKAGTGASPTARSTVSCHYEGKLIDGTVFDSSYKRGEPAEFPVGGVIAGWTEVLQLMKEGGEVEVYIPSSLAYGDRGAGGAIGPGETLIFKIELLKVLQ